jgi:hypothetical protein
VITISSGLFIQYLLNKAHVRLVFILIFVYFFILEVFDVLLLDNVFFIFRAVTYDCELASANAMRLDLNA